TRVGRVSRGPLLHGTEPGSVPSARRPSARLPQLMGKPRPGRSPIAEDGGLGYAEQLGAFRHIESAEEPALDHERLTWLKPGELLQGSIEAQQLVRAGRRR